MGLFRESLFYIMDDLTTKEALNEILDFLKSSESLPLLQIESIDYGIGVFTGLFCVYIFFQVFQSRIFR